MAAVIKKGTYKDLDAVIVETEKLIVTFLPSQGGKMTSLVYKSNGKDYLAQRKEPVYRKLGHDTDYVSAECAAYDDMFLTIDPWEIPDGPLKGARYLDHGEVCRMVHEFTVDGDCVRTFVRAEELPYTFEKTITENERGGLRIDFTATNIGEHDFDYIWASHFMACAEEGGQVITPYGSDAKADVMFSNLPDAIGDRFDRVTFPYGKDGKFRLDISGKHIPPESNHWKFYMSDPFPEGWLGYRYPSDNLKLMLRFNNDVVKYGGAWMNDGHGVLGCFYNAALEVCTGNYDRPDTAREMGQYSVLKVNSSEKWYLEIDIEDAE